MKRIVPIILTVILSAIIISCGIMEVSAYDGSVYSGTSDTSWYNDGQNSFTLSNAAQFAGFVELVNGGKSFSGKTVSLATDIVWASGDASFWDQKNAPATKWTPIGNTNAHFDGTFDGCGHQISGLYYYNDSSNGVNVGLFGYVKDAKIKNVGVTNSYLNAYTTVGGIVGKAYGSVEISGCFVNAVICTNYVTPDNHYAGGIIGYANLKTGEANISRCAFEGKILADNGCDVAGILGRADGNFAVNVSECLSKGKFVGYNRVAGIVGRTAYNVNITKCLSECEIYVFGDNNYGGILGGFRANNATVSIKKCFYTGKYYHASRGIYVNFAECNGRVGSNEFQSSGSGETLSFQNTSGQTVSGVQFGTFASDSYFYTDLSNDVSHLAEGNQRGTPMTAGFRSEDDFIGSNTDWIAKNIYGEVYLKNLAISHNCDEHFGEWISDTAGQKRACTFCNCANTETREFVAKIDGAQIKFAAPMGIRFKTTVNKNDFFKALYGTGDYAISEGAKVSFGTLIIPTEKLNCAVLDISTPGAQNSVASFIFAQDANTVTFTGTFMSDKETVGFLNQSVTARSYMKVSESGKDDVYYYSSPYERSIYEIARQAYSSQNDNVKSGLNEVIGLGCISDDFYSESAQNVIMLENATPALFAKYKSLLEANGFAKHSENTIAENLFATYYNDDYIVHFYYTPKTVGKYTQRKSPYDCGQSMSVMRRNITIAKIENILRIVVDRRDHVDLPTTEKENVYTVSSDFPKNRLIEIKPNDILKHYGMGYVIQLRDGSFIMIDGGENVTEGSSNAYDCENVYKVLRELSGGKKPVIAAWIITHSHNDHIDMMRAFLKKYTSKDVTIEQVMLNFGEGLIPVETERGYASDFIGRCLKANFPDAKYVRAHTGQKSYIRNAELTFLFTMDDFSLNDVGQWVNNESPAFQIVIDGKQKMMFTGEIFLPGSTALIDMYGTTLESDVLQMSHHGHFGATKEVYELIMPQTPTREGEKFVLWPCGNYNQVWSGDWQKDKNAQRYVLEENKYVMSLKYPIYYYYDIGEKTSTAGSKNAGGSAPGGSYTIIPLYTK